MNKEISTELSTEVINNITVAEKAYQTAGAMVVSGQPEYESAGDFIADLKAYKKGLVKDQSEFTGPLEVAKKKIFAKFKPHITKIDEAIASVNSKMTVYFQAEEKKRREAEAAAVEKARKEQERLLKRADKADDSDKPEKAEALREQASVTTVAIVVPTANKQTTRTTMVTTWSAQVYDKLALIEAVAKGEASMELLDVNQSASNKMATAQKNTLKIPGVRAKSSENVRAK